MSAVVHTLVTDTMGCGVTDCLHGKLLVLTIAVTKQCIAAMDDAPVTELKQERLGVASQDFAVSHPPMIRNIGGLPAADGRLSGGYMYACWRETFDSSQAQPSHTVPCFVHRRTGSRRLQPHHAVLKRVPMPLPGCWRCFRRSLHQSDD